MPSGDMGVIVACPVCRAVCIAHPGEPPSTILNCFYNRCTNRALKGLRGTGGTYHYWRENSYRSPQRYQHKVCGAPLTTEHGELVPIIPFKQYRAIISQPCFDVRELWKLAYPEDQ